MEALALALLPVVAAGVAGWLIGRRPRAQDKGVVTDPPRLEEYPFYPFRANEAGHVEFDADAFDAAVFAARGAALTGVIWTSTICPNGTRPNTGCWPRSGPSATRR